MKAPSAIINSSAGLALFTAGCACAKEPVTVQALDRQPTVHRQAAAQRFQPGPPLQTPTFASTAKPLPRPPQTEAPSPPSTEPIRDAAYEEPIVTAPPSVSPAQPKPSRSPVPPAQPPMKNQGVRRKALSGGWNSVIKGGKGSAPAGKSSKISGATGAMGIS